MVIYRGLCEMRVRKGFLDYSFKLKLICGYEKVFWIDCRIVDGGGCAWTASE